MATTNSNLLITKTTVVLDEPSDWQKWIFLRKDSAQRNDLWAHVNPDIELESLFRLVDEKPAKREAGLFYGREREDDTVYDLEHLNEHEYRKYSAWYSNYQKELTKLERRELALRQFNSEIVATISERRLHWIMNLDMYLGTPVTPFVLDGVEGATAVLLAPVDATGNGGVVAGAVNRVDELRASVRWSGGSHDHCDGYGHRGQEDEDSLVDDCCESEWRVCKS